MTSKKKYLSNIALQKASECLRLLGHPHRLQILQLLLSGRYSVGELAEACEIPSHMASEHLKLLQRCGFLKAEREGRNIFYQVSHPCLADFMTIIQKRFRTDEGEKHL